MSKEIWVLEFKGGEQRRYRPSLDEPAWCTESVAVERARRKSDGYLKYRAVRYVRAARKSGDAL